MSQRESVIMIRLLIKNNHDQYRNSKQINKILIDFVTKAFSSNFQFLLLDLLNKTNVQIQKTHDEFMTSKIKIKKNLNDTQLMKLDVNDFDSDNQNDVAQFTEINSVDHENDVEMFVIDFVKSRVRKTSKKFSDKKYYSFKKIKIVEHKSSSNTQNTKNEKEIDSKTKLISYQFKNNC